MDLIRLLSWLSFAILAIFTVQTTEISSVESVRTEAVTPMILEIPLPATTPTAFTFPEPGSYTVRDDYRGIERQYRLYIPQSYADITADNPVPLIIVMHGAGGDGRGMEEVSAFSSLAETAGFIVIYPDGLQGGWNDNRPTETSVDDVGYLTQVIDYLTGRLYIDVTRVYATGYSMGGMMAFRLGCVLPERIAAVASVASTFPRYQRDECDAAPPVPVMMVVGTMDEVIPWGGSIPYFSAGSSVEWWVEHNACEPVADVIEQFDTDPNDNLAVRRETFNQCADGTEVTIYGAINGGHTWPGHPFAPVNMVGLTAMDIDATQVIYEFFMRHQG